MGKAYDILNFIKWQTLARTPNGSITMRIYYGRKYNDVLTRDDNLYYVYWKDIKKSDLLKYLLGTFCTDNSDYKEFIEYLNKNFANGEVYEIKDLKNNVIKLMIPKEKDYKCFKAEFLDIIMPSLIDALVPQPFLEGPYEYGDVRIRSGANVLDLGANYGLFSALASSKGANVYAFEPTPSTFKEYLVPLSQVCDNLCVINKAVSDKTGNALFSINETSSCNSLLNADSSSQTVQVDTMSIDDFVSSMDFDHLDFIKADIEGAERLMLKGAQNTLREYAPDLAICYYHKLDDERVLTDLILSANPEYEISKAYKKIYAHSRKR